MILLKELYGGDGEYFFAHVANINACVMKINPEDRFCCALHICLHLMSGDEAIRLQ